MTERLSDIDGRITGVRQLGAVVNAMRGIAAARAQQARGQLVPVDTYAAAIAAAIARVLPLLPAARATPAGQTAGTALVLFCAEQGFAGAFSEHVLDAVGPDLATAELFLIGGRGRAALGARGLTIRWSGAMPSHSPGIPKLADGLAQAIERLLGSGKVDRLDVVYGCWTEGHGTRVERRRLFPFDTTAFPPPAAGGAPLLNLAPAILLSALAADYVHAQLCQAALHAFAAENEARMEAMTAARAQVERELTTLQAMQRRVRQEEITAEIIELAAGETASRGRR